MSFDDSGPAFPTPTVDMDGIKYPGCTGMSLRDWFAGQALAGITGAMGDQFLPEHMDAVATSVYAAADAMLAEREKE